MNTFFRKIRSAFRLSKQWLMSQRFGVDPARIYAKSFYEDGGSSKTPHSAAVLAEWAISHLKPASVLDFGSGSGHYLRAFAARQVEALGLEASPAGVGASGATVLAIAFDLRRPLHLSRPYDIAICVEVAEHVPKRHSDTLVSSICRNARRYVLFTAAPPGSPGLDHINCQPAEFWEALFRAHGFSLRADLTEDLRATAQRADTAEWWKSWAWCFERQPAPASMESSDLRQAKESGE